MRRTVATIILARRPGAIRSSGLGSSELYILVGIGWGRGIGDRRGDRESG